MKRIIKPIIYTALVAAVMLVSSCKKDFLDVNENPNNPENVDVKFVLPTAQSYLGYTMGNQLSIAGGFWTQYWTQGPNASQYEQLDKYMYPSSESDRPWSQLYSGVLRDLTFVYKAAQQDSTKKNYGAIARILQAYTYQVIADGWGAAPFSEACRAEEGILSPKYDTEEQIYDGIIAMLDEGIAMLDDNAVIPGNEDLIYGDFGPDGPFLWSEFANTLKLKIYLRQSGIRPALAQQKITEMFANGDPFLEVDARLTYIDQKFGQGPLFTTSLALNTTANIFGSATIIDYMNGSNDPRVADFFAENGGGNYFGLIQGEGKTLTGSQSDGSWSKPSDQIMGPTSATYLLTVSESYFLQAEAIARGWGTGDDQLAYETGIEASFLLWENAGAADLTAFLAEPDVAYPAGGTATAKLNAIFTQKWVAMAGNQNFEAWTEWRRTGVPTFTPSLTTALGANEFPARLPYSTDEVNKNSNVPPLLPITTPLWWDVN